ncbi:putative P-loop containing nucleoside triphosphate hydrolase [Lupinus albus]|uniref:Putative P-loop containing nucleoside triphosphate hydrolase n=1 Tax=Lupinus albus TaxID=3870 RepID=A0A6A4PP75_LUPAL|nr:putative P-loop containing nucleoside triphosphate hydrolase [Lupinus albus]
MYSSTRTESFLGREFVDKVFSWSITDVLNENLYQNKVQKIPETFSSTYMYMDSFILPLIEETHADLLSCMSNDLAHAPICEITNVSKAKKFQLQKNLTYDLFFSLEKKRVRGAYIPVVGDLIALTNMRPKCIDDLNRSYVIAYVHKMKVFGEIIPYVTVLSSKPIMADDDDLMDQNETMFGVYLTNLTTNIRIWRSLKGQLEGGNMKIIDKVLQAHHSSGNSYTCEECLVKELSSEGATSTYNDLNDSQRDAVLSCISLVKCHHMNTIKLIWGPPGTGKTTTVSVMLLSLLKLNCRTLTCAPTNVAIIEIAKRVLKHVRNERVPRFGSCYDLGDIVLFGNEKRMDMEHHKDLNDVFLDYRVAVLRKCLRGWKYSLSSMISLLEDPKEFYNQYLLPFTIQNMKILEARKTKKVDKSQNMYKKKEQAKNLQPLTFEEYISKSFHRFHEELNISIVNMYKHLPTSSILHEDMEKMFRAHDLLQSMKTIFESKNLTEVFSDLKDNVCGLGYFSKWRMETKDCLHVLKQLPMKFSFGRETLRDFCMAKACLIFCTVSSSVKLHFAPIELLVIDEAAMLKECESTIPLQLRGLRHTILIGDDRQLPAMVQSKICGKAEFGRSLFERLVQLGHKKHLLNVQHRMHPTISLFPNIKFYESQIVNAESVREVSYNRSFLPGKMYGSYSFIDVPMGKEEFDENHSRRNMVEASIVCELVKKLHQECGRRKTKVRIGVISPYKAQVFAIKNEMKLVSFSGGFEVNVRSVDGFQGGEEDVIIISTVRCNDNGSIGFLSDRRRVNVALTRARHCLWILGNGTTLLKSKSVWETLVIDAKNRGVFYKAQEDNCLSMALLYSLFELKEMDSLQNLGSSFFTDAIWKVCFNDEFWHSMRRVGNRETLLKEVFFILEKLSNGWREINMRKQIFFNDGISSQLLEIYNINRNLNLIWNVDIIEENLQCTQVIRVWAIVHSSKVHKIAKCVDSVYKSYTPSEINCCKYKFLCG